MPTIISISKRRALTKAKITNLESEFLASQLNAQGLRDERKRVQTKLHWADPNGAEAKYNEQLTQTIIDLEAIEKKVKTLEEAIEEEKVQLSILDGIEKEKDLYMQSKDDGTWQPVPNQIASDGRQRTADELTLEQADLNGQAVNPIARMNAELERAYSEILVRIQAYADEQDMEEGAAGVGVKDSG